MKKQKGSNEDSTTDSKNEENDIIPSLMTTPSSSRKSKKKSKTSGESTSDTTPPTSKHNLDTPIKSPRTLSATHVRVSDSMSPRTPVSPKSAPDIPGHLIQKSPSFTKEKSRGMEPSDSASSLKVKSFSTSFSPRSPRSPMSARDAETYIKISLTNSVPDITLPPRDNPYRTTSLDSARFSMKSPSGDSQSSYEEDLFEVQREVSLD
eukprot:TRINITY_DN7101_c0_g1_i2.p1 TRINITY_DN7101_c0_g1~~TRINITY_DN7101_c0_g1_i2.p1  ORF type:complete len:207 (+),score=41.92 TRINITY_DN7101_c0_g1_i2:49-669(+)